MTVETVKNVQQALEVLKETGLLLVSGTEIPDVCRLITGKPIKGSWWSNPSAQQIFDVNEALDDHPDVTIAKLVSGKVTFVHRQLWSAMFMVATERSEWQMQSLSPKARVLLKKLDEKETLISTQLAKTSGVKPGTIVRELEVRLLLHSDQIHTESGAHAKILETWEAWAKRIAFKPKKTAATTARRFLEKRLDMINQKYDGHGRLPWQGR